MKVKNTVRNKITNQIGFIYYIDQDKRLHIQYAFEYKEELERYKLKPHQLDNNDCRLINQGVGFEKDFELII